MVTVPTSLVLLGTATFTVVVIVGLVLDRTPLGRGKLAEPTPRVTPWEPINRRDVTSPA